MRIRPMVGVTIMGLAVWLALAACSGDAPSSPAATLEPAANQESAEHMESDEHMEEVSPDEQVGDEMHDDEAMHDDDEMHDDEAMHDDNHMHVEPPAEFEDLVNPYADDAAAIAGGEVVFQTYCAPCHGESGEGDGPASVGLDPVPASLADPGMMGDLSDGYLFWRVSKGGAMEPFNSAMPAWENALSEDERWQVISFIRTLSEP